MEPVGPVRSVEHKAAMEEGYAPAAFESRKDDKHTQDEDADPVLKELKYVLSRSYHTTRCWMDAGYLHALVQHILALTYCLLTVLSWHCLF